MLFYVFIPVYQITSLVSIASTGDFVEVVLSSEFASHLLQTEFREYESQRSQYKYFNFTNYLFLILYILEVVWFIRHRLIRALSYSLPIDIAASVDYVCDMLFI